MKDLHLRQLVKEFQKGHGLVVDGICGPETLAVLEHSFREDDTLPNVSPVFDGPLKKLPRTRTEVYEIFGNPGVGKVDSKWERANIVKATIPGLSRHLWIHKFAEPYVREGIRRARKACPEYLIESAACFAFRHQQWNEAKPLSYHSWGIAIDINPEENRLIKFGKGQAPSQWSQEWISFWPKGLSREFVQAMKSVGFSWGGDWDREIDPMHFELIR